MLPVQTAEILVHAMMINVPLKRPVYATMATQENAAKQVKCIYYIEYIQSVYMHICM